MEDNKMDMQKLNREDLENVVGGSNQTQPQPPQFGPGYPASPNAPGRLVGYKISCSACGRTGMVPRPPVGTAMKPINCMCGHPMEIIGPIYH